MRHVFTIMLLFSAGWCLAGESPPLLELGAGVGVGSVPKYPGSADSYRLALPSPAARYRGNYLKSDEKEGTRIRLIDSVYVLQDWSGDANLPVKSSDIPSRTGMPNLRLQIAAGPRMAFLFPNPFLSRLSLDFLAKGNVATNFHDVDYLGLTYGFGPNFQLYPSESPFTLNALLYLMWGEKNFHRYYYEVSEPYETASRPAYLAASGYFRTEAYFSIGHRRGSWTYFLGHRFEIYQGNVNKASPLLERKVTMTTVAAAFYYFYQSDYVAGSFL